jgi:hypothetical protein
MNTIILEIYLQMSADRRPLVDNSDIIDELGRSSRQQKKSRICRDFIFQAISPANWILKESKSKLGNIFWQIFKNF